MNAELLSRLKKLEKNNPLRLIRQRYAVGFICKSGNGWETLLKGEKILRSHPDEVIEAVKSSPINKAFIPDIYFVDDVPMDDD